MSSNTDPIQTFPPVTAADMAQHTEQALVELIYVGTGNQMLGSALANLESALNTTQSVLNILQNLQNLHNQISVKSKSAFSFDYKFGPSGIHHNPSAALTAGPPRSGQHISVRFRNANIDISIPAPGAQHYTTHFEGNITDYQRAYNSAASAYFGQAINPFFVFASSTASGYHQFLSALTTLKSKLQTEIQTLSAQTPGSSRTDPNTLLGTVKKVYNELPSNFNFSTVEKWILDNYVSHGSTGAAAGGGIQNDISSAITAAENLNDTQKEKVRRYLFIFQEYYQSASAILSSLTQIITKMAQKIAQ
jgi:hypothetical protein